jgi:ATP-dependent helicase IRC3
LAKLYPDKKVLVLAHRKELLEQSQKTFLEVDPSLNVQIEQGGRSADRRANVVVASVATLNGTNNRLERLTSDEFGSIIVDECHHAPAPSYLHVLSHFGLVPDSVKPASGRIGLDMENAIIQFSPKPEAPFLVGFTATPHRTDRIGLGWIFDDIVYSKTLKEMIEAGWLCRIRAWHIETGTDIKTVSTRAGDFIDRELSNAVNIRYRNDRAVASYKNRCPDRSCLVFCVDVDHARQMVKAFLSEGIDARLLVGTTPNEEREQVIGAFRKGEFKVLVGVGIMTEGFDVPHISSIIMARPTISQLLYTQMIGRGTRNSVGKEDLLVIDLVDNTDRLDLASLNTLFGLRSSVRLRGQNVLSSHQQDERQEDQSTHDPAGEVEYAEKDVDLLEPKDVHPRLQKYIEMPWVKTSYGYWLRISGGTQIGVIELPSGSVQLQKKEIAKPIEVLDFSAIDVPMGLIRAEQWVKLNNCEPDNLPREDCSPGQTHFYKVALITKVIAGKKKKVNRHLCTYCFHSYDALL